MLCISPCILGIESDRAWREHRDELFRIIAPVGYLEELWTTLLAVLSGTSGEACARRPSFPPLPSPPRSKISMNRRRKVRVSRWTPQPCARLPKRRLGSPNSLGPYPTWGTRSESKRSSHRMQFIFLVTCGVTVRAIRFFARSRKCHNSSFDDRTAGLFRKALQVYAGATRISPEALRSKCICFLHKMVENADDQESEAAGKRARWELGLERERVRRILLEPTLMEAMTRSQNGLERSVYKALHEIQRFQAVRRGTPVNPPEVLEVDLTTPNGPSRRS